VKGIGRGKKRCGGTGRGGKRHEVVGRDSKQWGGTGSSVEGQGEVGRDSKRWEGTGSGEEGQEVVGSTREECGRIWRVGDGLGEVGRNWES